MVSVTRLDPWKAEHWLGMKTTFERAAPPTVRITEEVLAKVHDALKSGEMEGWLFLNGTPISIALTMIREDVLLGKREMLIYAAVHLRKMTEDDWDACFAKMRLHSISRGCTHLSCYTVVPRILEMAARMGGDIDTRYVSIPLGGKDGQTH